MRRLSGVTDVTEIQEGTRNLSLLEGGRHLGSEAAECAPFVYAVTSVTSATTAEGRGCTPRCSPATHSQSGVKSHQPATGQLTPASPRLTSASQRFRPAPGANQARLSAPLRWLMRGHFQPLPAEPLAMRRRLFQPKVARPANGVTTGLPRLLRAAWPGFDPPRTQFPPARHLSATHHAVPQDAPFGGR